MLYRMLSDSQRIILPVLLSIVFIHMFFLYKKDNAVPGIMLKSNFFFSFGCLWLAAMECLKQIGYKKEIENMIFPFILSDFSVLVFFIGAVLVIKGCFLHPKYMKKKLGIYMWIVLLVVSVAFYMISRFIGF